MNISAVSMVNRMPSFSGQKPKIHVNGGDDWYHETFKMPKDEVVICRNSDEDTYPQTIKKTPVKTRKPRVYVKPNAHYELGPDGKTLGTWTRDGGGDVFFKPAVTEGKKQVVKPQTINLEKYYGEWV